MILSCGLKLRETAGIENGGEDGRETTVGLEMEEEELSGR